MRSIHSAPYKAAIDALVEARIAARLTQEDVAKRWGRTQSIIAKIENCERRIDVVELIALTLIVGLEPDKLVKSLREKFF